jgi:hypothetical protein
MLQLLQPYFVVRVALNAWLQLRLNVLGGSIAFVVACLCVFLPSSLLPTGLAAVTLTYGLFATRFLFLVVFLTTEVEVSVCVCVHVCACQKGCVCACLCVHVGALVFVSAVCVRRWFRA